MTKRSLLATVAFVGGIVIAGAASAQDPHIVDYSGLGAGGYIVSLPSYCVVEGCFLAGEAGNVPTQSISFTYTDSSFLPDIPALCAAHLYIGNYGWPPVDNIVYGTRGLYGEPEFGEIPPSCQVTINLSQPLQVRQTFYIGLQTIVPNPASPP